MTPTDAVVIGAGPVGLFQVFELGLLGLGAHVVDTLPAVGGQCVELYANKPIYDIPGVKVCTGRELIDRLMAQIAPFKAPFHLGQQVDVVEPLGAPGDAAGFRVVTSAGVEFAARTVIVAAGAGSFQPRRLKVEGLAAFEGRELHYSAPDATAYARRRVVVIGDGDAALELAIELVHQHAQVTLMHRRDDFRAAPLTIETVRQLRASGRLNFIAAQPTGYEQQDDRLVALQVQDAGGVAHRLPLDALLVRTGLSPKLGPIADWGLALERKQVVVDTATFETSVPGIFAVGDIVSYPGKKRLILCGFHEAALAAYGAAARIAPERPLHLEYTTTSPRLHRALGVA